MKTEELREIIFREGTVNLSEITYEQIELLSRWCRDASSTGGKRYNKYCQQQEERRTKAGERADRKRKEKESRAAGLIKWVKENLKEGQTLKFTGCRDGHGFREFIRFDNLNSEYPQIVCWQLDQDRHGKLTRNAYVTTHMLNKVSKVNINGQLVSVKNLVK